MRKQEIKTRIFLLSVKSFEAMLYFFLKNIYFRYNNYYFIFYYSSIEMTTARIRPPAAPISSSTWAWEWSASAWWSHLLALETKVFGLWNLNWLDPVWSDVDFFSHCSEFCFAQYLLAVGRCVLVANVVEKTKKQRNWSMLL